MQQKKMRMREREGINSYLIICQALLWVRLLFIQDASHSHNRVISPHRQKRKTAIYGKKSFETLPYCDRSRMLMASLAEDSLNIFFIKIPETETKVSTTPKKEIFQSKKRERERKITVKFFSFPRRNRYCFGNH